MAGSIVVPISALCPAIGAILARFLFRQPLTPRMMLGILICLSASALIGFSSMGGIEARPHMMLGLFFGFLAALGWGIEGCVCGYGVSIIDSEVGITIREVTIGISNLIILVPILYPIITSVGVNPYHFAMIICVNLAVGQVTPPFGCNLFVACGTAKTGLEAISKKIIPFIAALIVCVLLVTYIEPISLFLPRLLGAQV